LGSIFQSFLYFGLLELGDITIFFSSGIGKRLFPNCFKNVVRIAAVDQRRYIGSDYPPTYQSLLVGCYIPPHYLFEHIPYYGLFDFLFLIDLRAEQTQIFNDIRLVFGVGGYRPE
jgi:hypothetical protein